MNHAKIGQLRTPIHTFFHGQDGWKKSFWDNRAKNAGWMEIEVQEVLFNAARLADDGLVVEIGSYQGLSTANMAAGRKLREKTDKQKMFAIDPFCDEFDKGGTNNRDHFQPIFEENMRRCDVLDMINIICALSKDVHGQFQPNSIEVLFVDGDHTYEGIRADYDNYIDKLMFEGLVMFHDAPFEGPTKFLNELEKDNRVVRVLEQNSMRGYLKIVK